MLTDEEIIAFSKKHGLISKNCGVFEPIPTGIVLNLKRFARSIEQAARREALSDAAKVCENHMAHCLDDKDIQKHWPRIKRENDTYGDLIRALAKQPHPD